MNKKLLIGIGIAVILIILGVLLGKYIGYEKAVKDQSGDFANLSSTNCQQLNTAETIKLGLDSQWKQRIESSKFLAGKTSKYNPSTEYTTYPGSLCVLSNGDSVVTYSHYYDIENPDGSLKGVYTKGVAHYDSRFNEIAVVGDLPCDIEVPPDATAPAEILSVSNGIVHLSCPGYPESKSIDKVDFDLRNHTYR